MKTNSKKLNHAQNLLNFFLALGLITLLLGPVSAVQAQAGGPTVPLSSQLKWADLGPTERAFTVNGESITFSGTSYQANEFNLEASDEISAYYSTTGLAGLGWQEVSTEVYDNGSIAVYFHASGAYAVVEMIGCETNAALTCLTVWQSNPTDIVPQPEESLFQPQAIGTLTKSAPANGATNVDTTIALSWNAYTGTDLNRYRYCIDKTNNSECEGAEGWTAVRSGRTVTVTLSPNTTYYWQVQAVLNDDTKVDANGGSWWSFTTKGTSTTVPGAFIKILPTNGATGQSITPTLVWQVSANAASYEYCVDTTNNNICDSNWVNTTGNFVTLMTGIGANLTYYWQVRAVNSAGVVYADTNNWASFTTAAGPANDTVDSATALPVNPPYENVLNTTAATLDTGTTNACSPALGLASVWYKYTATSNRRIYLDTFGTNYDTFIAVWVKNINGTLSLVTCNDNAAGLTQSTVNLSVVNGTTYYIQVAQKNSGSSTVATPGGTLMFHMRTFADVAANSPFWKYVEGIYAAGITGGCATTPDLAYCPTGNVTRAQMAIFLLKGIHGAAYTPPAVGVTTGFADVPVTHPAAAWIKQLAAEGITSGCGGSNYCPESPVTRDQMAVFLLRAKHGASYTPPSAGASTGFTDVPTSYWAADFIKQLAAEGITSGCGANLFCPASAVTRDQMAVFLSRTFSIPPKP